MGKHLIRLSIARTWNKVIQQTKKSKKKTQKETDRKRIDKENGIKL